MALLVTILSPSQLGGDSRTRWAAQAVLDEQGLTYALHLGCADALLGHSWSEGRLSDAAQVYAPVMTARTDTCLESLAYCPSHNFQQCTFTSCEPHHYHTHVP